ncbi:MAG TPA: adenylate/guanylate cyclase domain-containing protein [Desulfobacteraceae bacterium]|nr:adenylate/guanylate cyclase domain-containing protein [Desulfobacteraceae bacterium]
MSNKNKKFILKDININDHMYVVAFVLGILCWLVESVLVVFLYDINFFEAIIGKRQVLSSLIILCLFMIFASHAQYVVDQRKIAEERLKQAREEEQWLLEMTTLFSFELNVESLLDLIVDATKQLLSSDRCTLFIYDEKTDELWSRIGIGLKSNEIRFPCTVGIAGTVFQTEETINIPDAYSDPRFNSEVDKKTGYKTNSILCMPVKNKNGITIGVIQALNKAGGPFTDIDERRLMAFSAQASIALENAKLFEEIIDVKNYNESMIESMNTGIISLDADKNVVKCNAAAVKLFRERQESHSATPEHIQEVLLKNNLWVSDHVDRVVKSGMVDQMIDTDILLCSGGRISVNLTIVPLISTQKEFIGSLLIMEDITSEKRLKSTIARYMTKEVAEKLMQSGETALGGQSHEATVMFSDIRNFTSISESIGPQGTVSLLNEYLTLMVDIIFRYEGILDKYIGDAIMAVFGAPFSTGEDPDRAVKTAIDMMTSLREFNGKRIAEDKFPLNIGIGINSDEVISGNIGSMKRMDYTVIGDGVNLASRLEGANKLYGTNILISESTYNGLKNGFKCREVDKIRVKGKHRPVSVYQVLDYHDEESFPNLDNILEIFSEGLFYYRQQDWRRSVECFEQATDLNPMDTVSKLFAERCRKLRANPPGAGWDSVWIMESK